MEIEQRYELVDIDGDVDLLKEHPQNPNQGDDDVVDESVDVNGWYGAIIAQESTGYVLAGHTRLRVAKARGAKQVPVLWKDVDDEGALRILLADNQTARKATTDEDVLGQVLDSLGDLRGTGYGVSAALDSLEAEEAAEEASSAEPEDEPVDEVPDDVYTPQYGVMLVLETEEDQKAMYEAIEGWLRGEEMPDLVVEDAKLRVVAV